jgi:molybdate transport system substrate-binding protein
MKMIAMRRILSWALVVIIGCFGAAMSLQAGDAEDTRTITIGAAADLKFALDQLVTDFQDQHTNVVVKVSYGSSGNLFAQIDNGAPFDLFLSADIEFPRKLIDGKKAFTDSLFSYAIGRVVLWVPNGSSLDIEKLGMAALLDPSIRKIAIANPEHAPYGRAAVAAMKKLGVYDKVSDKLVLGENIAQAAQFVESKSADIGLIALSLALSPKMTSEGHYWEVPLDAYPRLEQGGVILLATKQPDLAREFRGLIIGPQGRATLRRYGFIMPE